MENNILISLNLASKKVLNNLYNLLELNSLTKEQADIITSCIWEIETALFEESNINVFKSCEDIGQEKN